MPRDWKILTLAIRSEADIVLSRQRARQIAALLGFETLRQTRLATAVSEVARNAFRYAGQGRASFSIEPATDRPMFVVHVTDAGPGIPEDRQAADRAPEIGRSSGIQVARRLVDRFELETGTDRGTAIKLAMQLPSERIPFSTADLAAVVDELASRPPESLLEELQKQHQEILVVLEGLTVRQEELQRLNSELEETNRGVMALYGEVARELDDTNRGVLALYAELDDRAEELRRANHLIRQFISYLSHEFRTPLRSAVALSELLLDAVGQPLGDEQVRHLGFIRSGSLDLLMLVDDLLDLARFDAGKIEVHTEAFEVEELFGALRGMLRPLASPDAVSLVFDQPSDLPTLHTDQRKLTQVLRNLISNALKFTARGEVRVRARARRNSGTIRFDVVDTGIGIAPEDHRRIFEDFTQTDNLFQRRVHGSGLGLPLSRRLVALLGGRIRLHSELGVGSTFSVTIPTHFAGDPATGPTAADRGPAA